ncbi:MAG TPA: antibiotic biosynthesis monooxygenase family protein [Actinomycetota bacterium]|nr:antibiotic biosynthesis monooxygenase family protein [Actinomycetota bacterium]
MPTALWLERLPVHPARVVELEGLLGEMVAEMRSAAGCLWTDASAAMDDVPSYLVLSEWRSSSDLEAWLGGAGCRELGLRREPWLRDSVSGRRFSGGA